MKYAQVMTMEQGKELFIDFFELVNNVAKELKAYDIRVLHKQTESSGRYVSKYMATILYLQETDQ